MLLAHGADIEAMSFAGLTPLHMASIAGIAATTKLLLAEGANPEKRSSTTLDRPLRLATLQYAKATLLMLLSAALLAFHADVEARDVDGFTPFLASFSANAPIVGMLLAKGLSKGAVQAPTSRRSQIWGRPRFLPCLRVERAQESMLKLPQ